MSRSDARVVAIVQARMSSSRLPGKVLAELGGRPALGLLLDRLARASELDDIAVATSEEASDDPVAEFVAGRGVTLVRGPLEDVLERYRIAAQTTGGDAIVRITADCPLLDPAVVDMVVRNWRQGHEDYVANVIAPRTFPIGQDVEVVSRSVLDRAAAEAGDPYDREHVTPWIRNHPERFPQVPVSRDPAAGEVRMVIDTPEDLARLQRLPAAILETAGVDEVLEALGAAEA